MFDGVLLMIKTYADLDLTDKEALYCVLNPKYKTAKAQYNWIIKKLNKILDDKYGLNPHFEFSVNNLQVFITVLSNNSKIVLTCLKSDLIK